MCEKCPIELAICQSPAHTASVVCVSCPDHPGAGPDGIDPAGTIRSMSRMGMEMMAGRGTINITSMIELERLCGHHEKSREERYIRTDFFQWISTLVAHTIISLWSCVLPFVVSKISSSSSIFRSRAEFLNRECAKILKRSPFAIWLEDHRNDLFVAIVEPVRAEIDPGRVEVMDPARCCNQSMLCLAWLLSKAFVNDIERMPNSMLVLPRVGPALFNM
jgi:hypothetical protein